MAGFESNAVRLLRTLSLESLRGFESVARHLSFTAAADELCLTQSAVSKQVKALEESLGRAVFVRAPGGICLTSDGCLLYDGVRATLERLGEVIEHIAQPPRSALAVSVTPSLASLWLAPRLARFRDAEPLVDLRIDGSETAVSLEREGFDVVIRLFDPALATAGWKPLARERIRLVACAGLAARIRDSADLQSVPLLHFHDPLERYPWMSWPVWLARRGVAGRRDQPGLHFSQYEHLLRAACEGAGVAIGRAPLIDSLLESGALAVVLPAECAQGMTHHLAVAGRSAHRPEVRRFCAWIVAEMAREMAGSQGD